MTFPCNVPRVCYTTETLTVLKWPSSSFFSILSQIVDVSSEDVKFREWLQRKFRNIPDAENADPTLPSRLPVTESHNVEPKQLPDPPKKPLGGQQGSSHNNSTKGQPNPTNQVVNGEDLSQTNGLARSRGPSPASTKSVEASKATKASIPQTRGPHLPKEDSDTASSVSSHGGRSSLMSSVTSPENPCSSDTVRVGAKKKPKET